jgi:hypothetical protein
VSIGGTGRGKRVGWEEGRRGVYARRCVRMFLSVLKGGWRKQILQRTSEKDGWIDGSAC